MIDIRLVAVVPLKGAHYPTWKVRCRMVLMKEGLRRIVTGEETAPLSDSESELEKFASRRDRALATIVLAVDPSLLYPVGTPEDPVDTWKKLANQQINNY